MTWVELVLPFACFVLVLFGPGWLIGRALGLRGLLALGGAPALSSAYYAVAVVVMAKAGISWEATPVVLGAVAVAIVGYGASTLAGTVSGTGQAIVGAQPEVWREQAALGLTWRAWLSWAVVVGSVIMIVPTAVGMGAPDAPLQAWDAVFHLNGVAFIHETGVADNVNLLYGAGQSVYYPTVWHAMVSLVVDVGGPFTTSTITAAANASTLGMGSVGWLVGLAAFAQACFPRRPAIVVLAVAVGSAFSMFPTVVLSTLAQWPNGLSVMLAAGAAAIVLTTVRSASADGSLVEHGTVRLALCSLVALVGVGAAHGTGVVGVAIITGPYIVAVVWKAIVAAWRGPRRRRLIVTLAAAASLAVAAICLVLRSSVLAGLMGYERLPQRSHLVSVSRTLFDVVLSPWPGALLVTIAVVIGAVAAFRGRTGRWLVVSTVIITGLAALAAGPENPLRGLTGIWYTQAARIEALYPITAAVLAATGIAASARWVGERWADRRAAGAKLPAWSPRVIGGVLVVVAFVTSAGFQAPQRALRFAQAYDPEQIAWGTMLSAEETELMHELPDLLDDDALIIADPFSGAPFAWSIGSRAVVFPQLNTVTMDAPTTYLLDHFREIRTDPQVCENLADLGVTHFYQDLAGRAEGAKVNPGGAGMRDVDTSEGFTVVAVAGLATLFEIDACG